MLGVWLAGVWEMGLFFESGSNRNILTGIRSLTLVLPYIFAAIGENTLHVFGAVNLISIPIGEKINLPIRMRLDLANGF